MLIARQATIRAPVYPRMFENVSNNPMLLVLFQHYILSCFVFPNHSLLFSFPYYYYNLVHGFFSAGVHRDFLSSDFCLLCVFGIEAYHCNSLMALKIKLEIRLGFVDHWVFAVHWRFCLKQFALCVCQMWEK